MVDRDIMIQERMEHFSSTRDLVKGQWLVGRVLDRGLLLFYSGVLGNSMRGSKSNARDRQGNILANRGQSPKMVMMCILFINEFQILALVTLVHRLESLFWVMSPTLMQVINSVSGGSGDINVSAMNAQGFPES